MSIHKRIDTQVDESQRFLVADNFITFTDKLPFAKQIIDSNIAELKIGPKTLEENIFFDINDDVTCQGKHMQWTSWISQESIYGNDNELLSFHQQNNK